MLRNEYYPDYAVHPGRTLAEVLKERGITQRELAARLGLSEKTVSQIVNGKAPVTPEVAVGLDRVTAVPARFWCTRQAQYDEAVARAKDRERLAGYEQWFTDGWRPTYREMAQRGWVDRRDNLLDQLSELLKFFGVVSPSALDRWWKQLAPSFRQSTSYQPSVPSLAAWVRQGEILGRARECNPYDESGLRAALQAFRARTGEPLDGLCGELQDACASVGVAFVLVRQLRGTRAYGAVRWLTPEKALLQLSLRYRRNDQFWYSFYHEAGHLLQGGKKSLYIDDVEDEAGGTAKSTEEARADQFARDMLIPPNDFERFCDGGLFTGDSIGEFAHEIGIAPGIVVGRLQHEGHVPWKSRLNRLKVVYDWTGVLQGLSA